MATVVAITDRPAWWGPTDNVVVVVPSARTLTWVPRDLWCSGLLQRINTAFAWEGHRGLRRALREHGIQVDHSVVVRRDACERALRGARVTVPVSSELRLWYPASPGVTIEVARKEVSFRPPAETLTGERIHQWAGGRFGIDRTLTDLDRIERQQVLIRVLLEQGFDFAPVAADGQAVALSDEQALEELRQVDAEWTFSTLDGLVPRTVDGLSVLVNPDEGRPSFPRRIRARLRRARRRRRARPQ